MLFRSTDEDRSYIIIAVDMDNLKIVNDRYGHDEGDFSLKHIAQTIKSVADEYGGVVGRLGGDEFACVLRCADDEAGIRTRIRHLFDEFNVSSDKPYNITASIGVYRTPAGAEPASIDEALALADEDLYKEIDSWFAEKLTFPPQCKNQEKVVCFFKTEGTEEMMKMIRPALWLLERYNHPYYMVYTNTLPGKIVYEDQYQVVVEVSGKLQIERLQESWSPED